MRWGERREGKKSRKREKIRGAGCRKRRKGYKSGGLRVHGRQERREETEVLGDLIIRLSSECYISNISVWK